MNYIGFTTSDEVWYQAQLDLDSGGLGLRSLSLHSSSAVITCFCSSRVYDSDDVHLTNALDHFNAHVSSIEKLSVNSARGLLIYQSEASIFRSESLLLSRSFWPILPAKKARLLSDSTPHATSWLSVIPSTYLGQGYILNSG